MLLGVITMFAVGSANAQITKVESVYPFSQNTFIQSNNSNNNQIYFPNVNQPSSVIINTAPIFQPITCSNYLNTFNKFNSSGAEMVKLQIFLNQFNGANLNGMGYYGKVTTQEVKNLQFTYGLPVTGKQYKLTTALINNLNCGIIAKRDRKVFKPVLAVAHTNKTIVVDHTTPNNKVTIYEKIKNTESKVAELIAQNMVNADKNKEKMLQGKKAATSTLATNTKSTTTFMSIINSELSNLKENYKSYLVVFFLVLALFWFLRKTATE